MNNTLAQGSVWGYEVFGARMDDFNQNKENIQGQDLHESQVAAH